MNRTKGILLAGSVTGLILIALLAFGLPVRSLEQQQLQEVPTNSLDTAAPSGLDGLEATNAELEAALRLMQERENAYQQELEAANQAILDMQDAAQQPVYEEDYEDEEHDEDDYEYEEEDDDDD
ncbi:hypothetical protein [Candidatus Leptofilum sp.]|uniref:hypothetical protein n=1 Tax=Candidatus Leptofilum sp. TaxID=3241576 RepID=UPI003B5AEDA9